MKKFNREELFVGSLVGATFFHQLPGVVGILMIFVCSVLWAAGGTFNKAWRRVGVSASLGVVLSLVQESWAGVLWIPMSFLILSVGYGTPSQQPPDEGSVFGRWAWKMTGGSELWSTILTRTVIIVALIGSFVNLKLFMGVR